MDILADVIANYSGISYNDVKEVNYTVHAPFSSSNSDYLREKESEKGDKVYIEYILKHAYD